jgi:2-phosphosulfolactate phosphatase
MVGEPARPVPLAPYLITTHDTRAGPNLSSAACFCSYVLVTFWDQHGFRVRLDWGIGGSLRLAANCSVIVVVDVLRFTTVVEVAVARGVSVEPLARPEKGSDPMSPSLAIRAKAGSRLRIHSPNGGAASLAASTAGAEVLAACFRNASAVALAVDDRGPVGLVAAGERWPDGTLRPCWEDLCGAGAVAAGLAALGGLSPEAEAAVSVFLASRVRLPQLLNASVSGRELLKRGRDQDIALAAGLDAGSAVPALVAGAFTCP